MMTRLLASVGLAAMALAQCESEAAAQTTDEEPSAQEIADEANEPPRGLGEIVVTAQRRAENLQDSALAISAFEGDTLEDRGVTDVAGLQSSVPNLHVGEEQGNSKISLRGIGLQGTSSISDSGIAFYLDNFYIARPSGGSATFYDIDRIEVLRGPQGTLYGRNAAGGVVNVITNRPQDYFEGEIGATYGSRDLFELRGVLNVPVAEEVAARVSAVYTQQDGYVENSFSPDSEALFGTPGDITVRGQLLIGDPNSLEVLIGATYSKLRSTGIAQQFLERNVGGPPPVQALLRTIPPDDLDPLVTSNDAPNSFVNEFYRVTAQFQKAFDSFDAYLLVGYTEGDNDLRQDFDGSPIDVSRFRKIEGNEAASAELRFSSATDGPFEWIVGGYWFTEDNYINRQVYLRGLTPGGIINLPPFLLDEFGSSMTLAGFASGTYSLTETFRLTAGLRYTHDEKDGRKITRGNFGQPFPPDIPNAQFPGEVTFDRLTYKAGVEWDLADDILAYANISNGYKAGGFNLTSSGAPYDPESITAYQAGIKSDLFDRRVRLNADVFYYDYTDLQLTTLTTINGAPGQFTTNAASSEIYGVELEAQFAPTDNLLLSASYAYIDATFGEYFNTDPRDPAPVFNPTDPSGLGRTDLSGNRIPYVSNHTINLGLKHDLDLGSAGELTTVVAFQYHDEFYLREYNLPIIDLVPQNRKTDIAITWRVADTGLRLTGYVNNLEDDVEKNNIYISPGFIGLSATTAYTRPREFGLRVDYEF